MNKQILVTVNPEFQAEDGTQFDAVVSALEHFGIPANLIETTPPEVIAVTLSNGDVALFVNQDAIYQRDASDSGQCPSMIGEYLAKALGVELLVVNMDEPSDEDWSWNDVYELLPADVIPPKSL